MDEIYYERKQRRQASSSLLLLLSRFKNLLILLYLEIRNTKLKLKFVDDIDSMNKILLKQLINRQT